MIKLILGNAIEVLPQINEKVIIVTDPPFNIGYHYNEYKDNMDEESYFNMLVDLFKHQPSVVIHYPESLYKLATKMGKCPQKVISWVYNSNTAKQHRDIAFFDVKPDFRKYGQPYKNPTDKRIVARISEGKQARLYDWWQINQVKNVSKEKTKHPCQMPLEVMMRIIGILPDNVVILDPFMGTGTTGLACKLLNRDFIGIEIDPIYYEIAENRLNNEPI